MSSSEDRPFDAVKDQIAPCGIWCGSCVAGNGALSELARKFRKTTEAYALEQWAPKDFDYAEFAKGLASIGSMPPCPGCLKGGGRDDCKIRVCAQEKQLHDCSACPTPNECQHVDELRTMRSGAADAGLFVRDQSTDTDRLLKHWIADLKRRWPSSVLFIDDA
ncbi:MAG: hypothetical protein A2V70_04370 [Planctomycetes bacterium RBG_13_63_9]|nr:MAG: hypothetical protein A2V70_04370 [Planctomycetes bacterium RBG_13_63_9]